MVGDNWGRLGVLASIPTALFIVMATGSRRNSSREAEMAYWQREAMGHPAPPIEAQYRISDDDALVLNSSKELAGPRGFDALTDPGVVRIIGRPG